MSDVIPVWTLSIIILLPLANVEARNTNISGQQLINDSKTDLQVDPLSEARENWRRPYYCGVNSVYACLRMLGHTVEYEQVCKDVPHGRSGTTMKELVDAFERFGVTAIAKRGDISSLQQEPLPVILHVEHEGLSSFALDERGHYLVLLSITDETMELLDPTTTDRYEISRKDFMRKYSGYYVVFPEYYTRLMLIMLSIQSIVAVCLLTRKWPFAFKKSHSS